MKGNYIHGTTPKEQERLSDLNKLTNQSFIEYLGDCNNFKICDFGCGTGNLINDIADLYKGTLITGLELSKEQYERALENNKDNKNVQIINADIMNYKFPDEYFDLTYCRYLLEHVAEPVATLKEMARVTKKGGKIVCQENDLYNGLLYPQVDGYKEIRQKFCQLQIQLGGDPYIGRKLFDLLKKADLKNITLEYAPEIHTEDTPQNYCMWIQNTLKILEGVKDELIDRKLVSNDLFESVCSALCDRINTPEGAVLFHWNRAAGYKY